MSAGTPEMMPAGGAFPGSTDGRAIAQRGRQPVWWDVAEMGWLHWEHQFDRVRVFPFGTWSLVPVPCEIAWLAEAGRRAPKEDR
jgi:hypothetical protein